MKTARKQIANCLWVLANLVYQKMPTFVRTDNVLRRLSYKVYPEILEESFSWEK